MERNSVLLGAVLILLGIILGAFAAHALKAVLNPDQLASFETGVRYQLYHGFAFLIIGLNGQKIGSSLKLVRLLMLIGVLFFSGSIYLLATQTLIGADLRFLGPITPIGGLFLIASWCVFIVILLRNKTKIS